MGKFLDKYKNEFVTKHNGGAETEKFLSESKDPFEPYKRALEKNQSFEVKFQEVDSVGTLHALDRNGVKIILEAETLEKSLTYYPTSNKAKFVGRAFTVKVSEIDMENCIVYVRSAWNSAHSTRNKLIGEIKAELEHNEQLVLPGVIMDVTDKKCMVDLLGAEILGIININDWQNGYTRHLKAVVKKNEIYDFVVMRPLKERKGKTQAFKLTRVPITPDPWEELKKSSIGVDSLLVVQCVEKPVGRNFWWGVSPMINGIEIMGEFSTSIKRPLKGVSYQCKVNRYDPDNHKLQVVPFEVVDNGTGIVDAVNWIFDNKTYK